MSGPSIGSTVHVDEESDQDTVCGFEVTELDLLEPLGSPPNPPKCILERLNRDEKVWRWLSKPQVKYQGMRMYVAVKPTKDELRRMKAGDCPSGVYTNAENLICWKDDGFLGMIPRRLYDVRRKQVEMVGRAKEGASTNKEAIKDQIARLGGTLKEYQVEQTPSHD